MDPEASTLFTAADTTFIQDLHNTIVGDVSKGLDYGGILTMISGQLKQFQLAPTNGASLKKFPSWGPLACDIIRGGPADGPSKIRISAPFLNGDENLEIIANSYRETADIVRYLSAVEAACAKLEDIRKHYLAMVEKGEELEHEQEGLRQPAETTIDSHIRLLRQYNTTKDVGQQLIGMVAETRGVPLGHIYRDGGYGVNADD